MHILEMHICAYSVLHISTYFLHIYAYGYLHIYAYGYLHILRGGAVQDRALHGSYLAVAVARPACPAPGSVGDGAGTDGPGAAVASGGRCIGIIKCCHNQYAVICKIYNMQNM